MKTPEEFVYWLQGFFEIGDSETLTPKQVKTIKDELARVFNKVTPTKSPYLLPTLPPPPKYLEPYEVTCEQPKVFDCGSYPTVTKIKDLPSSEREKPTLYC